MLKHRRGMLNLVTLKDLGYTFKQLPDLLDHNHFTSTTFYTSFLHGSKQVLCPQVYDTSYLQPHQCIGFLGLFNEILIK